MEKFEIYESPLATILEVAVENGIAVSPSEVVSGDAGKYTREEW